MVDELFELILGENGFVVEVRCNYSFNDDKYKRIKIILTSLVKDWERYDNVPKKAMLAIVELMICLVGGNRFLTEEEMMKLEDASIDGSKKRIFILTIIKFGVRIVNCPMMTINLFSH